MGGHPTLCSEYPQDLHILIQPVEWRINYFALDNLNLDTNRYYVGLHAVKIALTETIGALKPLIKEQQYAQSDVFNDDNLMLWDVDMPDDMSILKDLLKNFKANCKEPLRSDTKILEVFSKFPDKNRLHIVAQRRREEQDPSSDVARLNQEYLKTIQFGQSLNYF